MWMATEATKMAIAAAKIARDKRVATMTPAAAEATPTLKKPAQHNPHEASRRPAKKPILKKPAANASQAASSRGQRKQTIRPKILKKPAADPSQRTARPKWKKHTLFGTPKFIAPGYGTDAMPDWMRMDENADWVAGKQVIPPPFRPWAGFRWLLDPEILCWEMQKLRAVTPVAVVPAIGEEQRSYDAPALEGMPAWMQMDGDGVWVVAKYVMPPLFGACAGCRWLLDPEIGIWEMQGLRAPSAGMCWSVAAGWQPARNSPYAGMCWSVAAGWQPARNSSLLSD